MFFKRTVQSGITGFIIVIFSLVGTHTHSEESGNSQTLSNSLIGYWKLVGDCKDYSGNGNHGINHGVDLEYSDFTGIDEYIEVPHTPSLSVGRKDFSVSAWVFTDYNVTDVIGDVLSKFSAAERRGFNLYMNSTGPSRNGGSDNQHIYFGIDNAKMSDWFDCGRPGPTSNFCSSLTVYRGDLYVATNDAETEEGWAHVYRYAGNKQWEDCGRVGNERITGVWPLIVHQGKLYAGTANRHRTRAVSVKEQQPQFDFGRVYRYEGGQTWRDCGQPGRGYRIFAFASYKGRLYVTVDDKEDGYFKCYVYAGDRQWDICGRFQGLPNALGVHNGRLYMAGMHYGRVHEFDGHNWVFLGNPYEVTDICSQIYDLSVYRGDLYASSWPKGRVAKYIGPAEWRGREWEDCSTPGWSTETMALTVYNGKLYSGSIPYAEVCRYEGGTVWTKLRRFYEPENEYPGWGLPGSKAHKDWTRLNGLTIFQGKLFASVGSVSGSRSDAPLDIRGKVYAFEAGKNVSYDDDLRPGWNCITAVKESNILKLYINGELQSMSAEFNPAEYDVSNEEPLRIGCGELDYFTGKIREVRLYSRSLNESEIMKLYESHR